MEKAVFNWSGGKDSALALYKAKPLYNIQYLLTTVNNAYKRVSMHGVRESLLDRQAESLGIELLKAGMPENAVMEEYEKIMNTHITKIKSEGIGVSIFGDIFLEDIREYRERKLRQQNIKAVFPLWKKDTRDVALEFISLGFKAIVVCVDGSKLSKDFAGRDIDGQFLADLPKDVCPCGENGEYHSFVYDGPIFANRIAFKTSGVTERELCANGKKYVNYYCDLE